MQECNSMEKEQSLVPVVGSKNGSQLIIPEEKSENERKSEEDEFNYDLEGEHSETYSSFSKKRKILIVFIVTIAGFLGPVSGNIYIPILPMLQEVFHVSETCINATVSVFMAVFALAPLIWAPWADFGGRKALYIESLFFFILANILLASLPPNIGGLYFLRIVQAFGASSVVSVGAGVIVDIIEGENRGKAISYFMLGPQLGPILGPILSSIASDGSWRWIFGFQAILGCFVYLMILFLLPETLRYLVGNGSYYKNRWIVMPKLRQKRIVQDKRFPKPPKPTLKNFYFMLKYKPVLLCSINSGLLFGAFYGMSVTFSRVLDELYHFSNIEKSISYICPGISLISGSISGGRLSDSLRKRILAQKKEYIPENRFSIQLVGLLISIAGLLGYGWSIQKQTHVSVIFIFTFLGGFGVTWVFVTTTTYLAECTPSQTATNVAIGNFMRNIAAAISSAIMARLIRIMGFGWCFTGLALTELLCVAILIVLIIYGPKWRNEFKTSLRK